MKHVFGAYNSNIDPRPFHPFTPDEWSQQTSTLLRTYLIQHLPNPNGPEPVPSGPIPSSRPAGYSPAPIELMGFKKGIKREIPAYRSFDVVQCAALVETNHGRVNLIMNEYACYRKGHTIHSSGQIEWFKNSVDDRSVQVGGN